MNTVILAVTAYFLGSIPNALWIGKVFKGIDIREHGSKNTGSTNAARVLGTKLGILTLILDIGKGALPTALAILTNANLIEQITGIIGSDAIFIEFRGGKAVATTVGVFTVLVPIAILFAAIVFFTVFGISKYVSLSSIIAAASLPILIFVLYKNIPLTIFGIIIAALIILKHKSNIERLKNGTETKFTMKKK